MARATYSRAISHRNHFKMSKISFLLLGAFLPCRKVPDRRKRLSTSQCLSPSEAAGASDYRLASAADGDAEWIKGDCGAPMDAVRPDILHQTLMQVLDSEANKFGYVDDIVIVLDGHPSVGGLRITSDFVVPRTYRSFSRCLAAAIMMPYRIGGISRVDNGIEDLRMPGDFVIGLTVGGRYLNSTDLSGTLKGLMSSPYNHGRIVIAMGVTSHTDPVANGALSHVMGGMEFISVSRLGLTASWAAGKVCEAIVL